MNLAQLGKIFIGLAVILLIIGGVLLLVGRFIGKLPGDIVWKHGNTTVFFPIVTCILISVIGTIVLNLFFRK